MVKYEIVITVAALDELNAEIIYHKLNTSEVFASIMKVEFMKR